MKSHIAAWVFTAAIGMALSCLPEPPPPGLTTRGKVVKVIDGDTLDVEVTRRIRVRLADCWAPERHHQDGPGSTENLELLTRGENGECILHIPASESGEIKDVFTFGRVVGRVWMDGEAVSVNEQQVLDGHATREKP